MRGQSRDPYRLIARYTGECNVCGEPIKKGAAAIYWPVGRALQHDACGDADLRAAEASFRDEDGY